MNFHFLTPNRRGELCPGFEHSGCGRVIDMNRDLCRSCNRKRVAIETALFLLVFPVYRAGAGIVWALANRTLVIEHGKTVGIIVGAGKGERI